jgi:imidazole glycerol-phosphate synthase subunit HisH
MTQSLSHPGVEVLDYGGGNLGSLLRALERLNVSYTVMDGSVGKVPTGNVPIILPGVGAFGAVMQGLQERKLDQAITALTKTGTPYLGICVGLQVLFHSSWESPDSKGLAILPGEVIKYSEGKVPQIGWNMIQPTEKHQKDFPSGYVYFVNSYYAAPENPEDLLYEAMYYGHFCAGVKRDNLTAFQFHPEKSGDFGHTLLKQWCEGTISSSQALTA